MNKLEFLKKITKDVFGTTKISIGKRSEKNLNRNSGYFLKCLLNGKSSERFNELFVVSLNIEGSQYEATNGRVYVINKKRIINNFRNYILNCFSISIYGKIEPDKNNPELNNYKDIIINITKNIISPELFCGDINDEINLESIKEKIKKFINNDSGKHNNYSLSRYTNTPHKNENIWFLLNNREKSEMLKNVDYWNQRISEADNSDMGFQTLNEYIGKLERESKKFYRNISTDILKKYLNIAQNVKEHFFYEDIQHDYFKNRILTTLDIYILKLKNMTK